MQGEQVCEMVVCMAVSKHFSLVATGNNNSIITIWDLETAKIVQAHLVSKDKEKIVFLEFLESYPILVSCTNDGVASAYAIKGAPLDQRY